MISKKVLDHLKKQKIVFDLIPHKTVYTAYDAAQTLKLKLNQIVKSLLVKVDKDYYIVSLPADKNLDFKLLAKAIKVRGGTVKKVSLPSEKDIQRVFKVRPGLLTAFGTFHKITTIVDRDLKKVREAVFGGGSVTQSIKMKVADYLKFEDAHLAAVGKKKKLPRSGKSKR